jgi:hypothetical protein
MLSLDSKYWAEFRAPSARGATRPIRPIRPTHRTELRFNPRAPAQAGKAPKMFSPCVSVGATIRHNSTTLNLGMNRIYQGKVTAVEIAAPHILSASNGERNEVRCRNETPWQLIGHWLLSIGHFPKALHHELFQDAVNF